jgi:formylglycine-generating enzyme required for sulfatase activity
MHILKLIALPLLASLPSLVLCGEATLLAEKPTPDASVEARVANLLAKVKASLRPLKGGTFEMGDWGNEEGVPYDFDAHSRPLHKVTLDGFSMMAYKVTFEDFDVFTDATGNERRLLSCDRRPWMQHCPMGIDVAASVRDGATDCIDAIAVQRPLRNGGAKE